MKVTQDFDPGDEFHCAWYGLSMVPDNGPSLGFGDMCGEPEDNTYYRDHDDILRLPEFIRAAYEAGRRGEELIIEEPAKEES